jgi:dihydrofolate reductase
VTQINLIFARSRNGVIGRDGTLPWHLPEDLAHFRRLTMKHPVLMGRKTWDSLPPKFRPLPGRRNLVLTRDAAWSAAGAERVGSLDEALRLCAEASELWVIGGVAVFAAAMPLAHRLAVTEIDADFDGDVKAPEPGASWQAAAGDWLTSTGGLRYRHVNWMRA